MNSGIEGVGGAVDDARTVAVEEELAPPDAVAPAKAGLAPAAKPLTPARVAPAATPPALTRANAVDPTSPEMILLAMEGINAMARAEKRLTSPSMTESPAPFRNPRNPLPKMLLTWLTWMAVMSAPNTA